MELQAAQTGSNIGQQLSVSFALLSLSLLSHPGHPMLVKNMRLKSWQAFYALLTKVHLIQSRPGGFHPVRGVSSSSTENNQSVLSLLCARTDLYMYRYCFLPSSKANPCCLQPPQMWLCWSERPHNLRTKDDLCASPSFLIRDQGCFAGHSDAVYFPRTRNSLLCFRHHVWSYSSFDNCLEWISLI